MPEEPLRLQLLAEQEPAEEDAVRTVEQDIEERQGEASENEVQDVEREVEND